MVICTAGRHTALRIGIKIRVYIDLGEFPRSSFKTRWMAGLEFSTFESWEKSVKRALSGVLHELPHEQELV